MVFHEITREAIREALETTRDVDDRLVRAQETRRILDRLFGYTLSPLLWKKIACGLSAGRVQSVAVRLLVQRERERRAFRAAAYWDLKAQLSHDQGPGVRRRPGRPRRASGSPPARTSTRRPASSPQGDVVLLDRADGPALRDRLPEKVLAGRVHRGEARHPPAGRPFTTSTLQQEANRKLRLSSPGRPCGWRRACTRTATSPTCAPTRSVCQAQAVTAAREMRRAALRQELPAGQAAALLRQERACPGGPRGHPARR